MSVYLRGKSYHYRFLFKGKDYSGVCSGCSTEGRAKEYERSIREKIRREAETLSAEEEKIRQNKTVRALVDNYSYVLTGGKPITLAEAYPLALQKPSRREPSEHIARQKLRYWNDFVSYMAAKFLEIQELAQVRKNHCETYVRYLIDHGWDETCGGGVHWKELNEHTTSKHSCSTGPTAVMGCKMYQATQEQEYLDWAIKCYDYMLDVLQDKSDHLFYDNVRPNKDDPNLPGDLEKNKYSYNSGQPLQAACLLYKITGEQKYLDEAYAIAESCHKKWFMPYRSKELNLTFNILAPGHAWFNTIMCRGFFELYSIDNDRKYIDDIEKSMIHAWSSSCHQGNNLLNDDDLRGGTTKTSWEILHQGALVELYARLAVLERENR